jgi:TatD DNase family protein
MYDTHAHLTSKSFAADLEAVLARARSAGVERILSIGTGIADGIACRALAQATPDLVLAAVGLDPFTCHDLGERCDEGLEALSKLLDEGGFCALGEIGLEYYHPLLPKPKQAQYLTAQLDLARARGLPVILHVREAHADMLAILARYAPLKGVVHCFSGDAAQALAYQALGLHLAFGGSATVRANTAIHEAVKVTAPDRLLLETDAPYLAPRPHRGKRNESALMIHTLEAIAQLRGEEAKDLDTLTTANALRLFEATKG